MDPSNVIILDGGAMGFGAAVNAASRGFSTLLLEQYDFAKGTSSRSTKLIHGGLRYLQQGNISLSKGSAERMWSSVRERPHLVHHLQFLVLNYQWWEAPFYGAGLKLYDMLAGKLGIEPSRHLNRKQTLKAIPKLDRNGLRSGGPLS